jgi:putative endonuclease
MASVYVLYSNTLNRYYIGSCKDLSYRIDQHINKDFTNAFTAKVQDWTLYFYIDELEYKQARMIEQHIKKMKSSTYVKNLKQYPEIIKKLIEKYP